MINQAVDSSEIVKCPSCGKNVSGLFKLTAEDIQRRFSPEDIGIYLRVCADCVGVFRRAARLEVRYVARRMFLDAAIMITVFALAFYVLFRTWTGPVFLITAVVFLTAGASILKETEERYAYTHNLVWSLRNRRVTVGFSVISAIILAAALAF
jgi:DNA-directed RNA polymerase subunit N (RpoN/RPB10)